MQNRYLKYIIAAVILILIAFVAFYWFFLRTPAQTGNTGGTTTSGGFTPFGNTTTSTKGQGQQNGGNKGGNNQNQQTSSTTVAQIPSLRLLSDTPVGGYGASTTASTTIIRWIDRGRGNVSEAHGDRLDITTLSNTLLPRVYESVWDKNLTSFIASIMSESDNSLSTLYAELKEPKRATSTGIAFTPLNTANYELKGKTLPAGISAYALSPKKDKIFLFSIQNGRGIGYISLISGGTLSEIFNTPVTQVTVEWPEDNTIAITTKGTADENGYLYFVSPKNGVWKKVLGPVPGLSSIVSHDAKYVLFSAPGASDRIATFIYNVTTNVRIDAAIQTLADKCTWGNFYKNRVYCAVPSRPVAAKYPDDWYKGLVSFSDKIWQVDATTGEVNLVVSLVEKADRLIDGFTLGTDSKDNFLVFMNKRDLSLWSLDLNKK